VLNYLQATKEDIASMSADNTQTIKWYIDPSFAIHKNMRSYKGAIITLRNRAIIANSTKQKVNSRSSTKSEMIAADNMMLFRLIALLIVI
jgi:hypothetical protein